MLTLATFCIKPQIYKICGTAIAHILHYWRYPALLAEKIAFYTILDTFIGKKKLKEALSNVLSDVK